MKRIRWPALLLLLVAWALRTATLTLQSMWIDEVMALYFTRGTFAETLHTIVRPEHNGPLYYLLLFWWRHLVGDSDFAVRYLSVLFSVLTIPLLYQLARRLLTERTAVLALWLAAFSPFTLWFAQEAKMYALHMWAATASTLALLEAFRKGRWWRWATYALLLSSTLYSHFFGGFLALAQVAMSGILGWKQWRRWLAYSLTMSLLALAHTPLLRFAWNVVRYYQPQDIWRYFVPLKDIARDLLGQYFYRLSYLEVNPWLLSLPAVFLIWGILALIRLRRRDAWILPVQALLPVLVFYPISFRAPVYSAKYLSAIAPAVLILAAWGIERMARLWRPLGIGLAVLGLLMVNGLVRDLTDPAVQRGDWRFIARYVETHEGPNDIVVISAFYCDHAFRRYYHGHSAIFPFEANPYEPEFIYQGLPEQYDRMWLILHHDQAMAPGNRLIEAADAMFPRITEQYPNAGQITMIAYQLRPTVPALPEGARTLQVCFQNGLCLAGYQVDATALPATENLSHPPSNWLHVTLYWQRTDAFDGVRFRPLVRLIDSSFNVWGGNMDRHPDLLDHYPPENWPTDRLVEAHYDLNLNPVTPPGHYRLEVSLAVNGDENQRVPLVDPPPGMPPDRWVFEDIRILP
ncbi:MAG: glycosyltransferase family 39 protein [Chloroflexi bacterium]|nr:glycosyltransferase family 39 protein [Chloroflexota bacterium]